MDDLISRQAAIKEIARWMGYIDEDMILRIQTGLKKLPSAQPEQRWIPCSERLPEERDGRVLVSEEDGEVTTGLHSEFSNVWYIGDMYGVGGSKVIAWMPLPEPYKEGQ